MTSVTVLRLFSSHLELENFRFLQINASKLYNTFNHFFMHHCAVYIAAPYVNSINQKFNFLINFPIKTQAKANK